MVQIKFTNMLSEESLEQERFKEDSTSARSGNDARTIPVPSRALTIGLDYWRGLVTGREMPHRADVDAIDIPAKLLPWTILAKPVEEGFIFQIVGSGYYDVYGFELTGKPFESISINEGYRDHIFSVYKNVILKRQPLYSESDLWGENGSLHIQRLLMPLGSADDGVTHILGFLEMHQFKRKENLPGVLHCESTPRFRYASTVERPLA